MKTIKASEFRQKLEQGGVHVVDVRSYDEYSFKHVPGSVSVPLDEIREHAKKLPANDTVYLICQSGNRSGRACQTLSEMGLNNVVSVEGGISAFEGAGGAVKSLTKTLPIMRQVQIGAGMLVLIGVVLSYFVHPHFRLLSGFVGAGLLFAGITGFCGMGILLEKMPWNRNASGSASKDSSCCGV